MSFSKVLFNEVYNKASIFLSPLCFVHILMEALFKRKHLMYLKQTQHKFLSFISLMQEQIKAEIMISSGVHSK